LKLILTLTEIKCNSCFYWIKINIF